MKVAALLPFLFLFTSLFGQLEDKKIELPFTQRQGTWLYMGGHLSGNLVGIIYQNNYGNYDLDYDIPYGGSIGAVIGKDWNNRHKIELGVMWSLAGQTYSDVYFDVERKKDISLSYVHVPLLYKFMIGKKASFHRNGVQLFLSAGVQLGLLASANIDWMLDGKDVSMREYILEEPVENSNLNVINTLLNGQANPENYTDLFSSTDIQVIIGGGLRHFLTSDLMLEWELRGGYGLVDIHSGAWQLPNREGEYQESKNVFGGLRVALIHYLKDR